MRRLKKTSKRRPKDNLLAIETFINKKQLLPPKPAKTDDRELAVTPLETKAAQHDDKNV